MGIDVVRMFIRVSSDLRDHWLARYPERKDSLTRTAVSTSSSRDICAFNIMLDQKTHQEMGFKPTVADRCLYTTESPDGLFVLALDVDDMLLLTPGAKYYSDCVTFLTLAMTLMFLARFTRSDILMPVSFLASRSAALLDSDLGKLMRVLRWTGKPLVPQVYADANH
eukprot:gene26393-32967_t